MYQVRVLRGLKKPLKPSPHFFYLPNKGVHVHKPSPPLPPKPLSQTDPDYSYLETNIILKFFIDSLFCHAIFL
jgi:hypothetical protein